MIIYFTMQQIKFKEKKKIHCTINKEHHKGNESGRKSFLPKKKEYKIPSYYTSFFF